MEGSTKISTQGTRHGHGGLAERGFRMLRFSDREALMQTEAVLSEIQNRL